MSLAQVLVDFKTSLAQCESLIANAHRLDAYGAPCFPIIDQQQITVAAFLNTFIAWEQFLESSLLELMLGSPTANGTVPTRYVTPPTKNAAQEMVKGVMRYFDYANHQNVSKLVKLYFQNGYPYEPHISAIYSDLDDVRTMRNSSAHISATTQTALEALALRIFAAPRPGIALYQMLTAVDPRTTGGKTVYVTYKTKLVVTAELIAIG